MVQRQQQGLVVVPVQLRPAWRLAAMRSGVASVTSYRSRSGRSTVMRWKPKASLGRIFTRSPSVEVAVEAGDLGDLVVADLLALLAEALAHLGEQLAGIDELDLAAALGRACGW